MKHLSRPTLESTVIGGSSEYEQPVLKVSRVGGRSTRRAPGLSWDGNLNPVGDFEGNSALSCD